MRDDFAIFILSHGRADNVYTVNTLHKCNYTGKWYILCDDGDKQLDKYKTNFGEDHVIVFNKAEAKTTFDIMDNFDGDGVPTFARNALLYVTKELGLTYFLELEDDYTDFSIRLEYNGHLPIWPIVDFDAVIDAYIEFLDTSKAYTVAFAQTGEMAGGLHGQIYKTKIKRKAMNAFFCRVDNPFHFLGRFNDDVNAYISYGKVGGLFMSTAIVNLCQLVTQAHEGGITEAYKSFGTYVKSFYSVMLRPDCVKIAAMGIKHKRVHHEIDNLTAYPMIVSSRFKKYE